MSVARNRREAAKRLGIELQVRYRRLVTASPNDADEVTAASVELGTLFNDNIEFIINVLKHYGGLDVKFEPMTRPAASANDLPKMPAIFSAGADIDLPKKPH